MSLKADLGWQDGRPPDVERAVSICQNRLDEIAARFIEASRGPITNAVQRELMELLTHYNITAFSMMNAVLILANGPAVDDPEGAP